VPKYSASGILHIIRKNWLFFSAIGIFIVIVSAFAVDLLVNEVRSDDRQEALNPFYAPPEPLPAGKPGDIIRSEPLGVDIQGGQGLRILYLTEQADGTRRAASGMVFYPNSAPPAGGRPVVAWAHPTVGMASRYAPSRTDNPVSDMTWLNEMISRGWVVTATDYAGLGTPGVQHYLVGQDEARDVLNSVRAARQIEAAKAGPSFAAWGHSQGGHAALFTALLAGGYAPELNLVATAAAAPAAEMVPLMSEQYNSAVGWVIGPQVAVSWPTAYPSLVIDDVLTAYGVKKYEETANGGVTAAGLEGTIRIDLKLDFFKTNPVSLTSWYNAATNETPRLPAGSKPVFIAQGLDDEVVLPNTTALLIQNSCAAGVDVTTLWLGGTGHIAAGKVSGPAVVFWLEDRFLNKPTSSSCGQIMPVQPAQPSSPQSGGS
jgi:pimeloyl-ACP methyl ester carboxylesterase